MTAYQHYELRCDHPGCQRRYNVLERRADVTRARAGQDGWAHGLVPPDPPRGGPARSLDFCPDHADELPRSALRPTLPMHAVEVA